MSQSQTFAKVMYADQTSAYATAATVDTVIPRVQRFTPASENGIIYDRGLGEGINAIGAYLGPVVSGGTVDFTVADFTFLEHWIGRKTGSGTVGTPYILTEATAIAAGAPATGRLQPFTLEVDNDTESTKTVDTYVGCVGDNFTLSMALGGKVECSATFVARHATYSDTSQTYTASTEKSYVMVNGTWKWGSTPSALSGVRSCTINYTNGLVVDTRSLDSRFMTIPVFGQREYNFSVDIIMTSGLATTIIADFQGASAGNPPEDGSTTTSPTTNLEFKVELLNGTKNAYVWLDNCSIDDISKPQAVGGGLVVLTFNGTAWSGRSSIPIAWWTT